MADFRIILSQLGLDSLKPKVFTIGRNPRTGNSGFGDNELGEDLKVRDSGGFELVELQEEDEPNAVSYLGTPVFSNLVLRSFDDSLSLQIDTVLMDVSMSKNIVRTQIQGRNGTFKEYVSDGDYNINIRGVLVSGAPRLYPRGQVQQLRDLLTLPEALIVESDFLGYFDIDNIVVNSFNFPQQEGFYNMQAFEINCDSDEPIELFI